MNIALAQLNYHIGNFEQNSARIKKTINEAKQQKCDLIVFAELAICGYPPLDFLDFKDFTVKSIAAIEDVASVCTGITAIVGGPSINPDINGKNLFNSAFVLSDGKISKIISKTLLPTYDVFDEYRWFESNKNFECIIVNGVRIALTVCEDLWNMDDDPLYRFWPMNELIKEKPQLMINIAASPFNYLHAVQRKKILEKNVLQYKLPLIYVNQVGGQTDILFDGGSLIYDENAKLQCEAKYFEEDLLWCEFDSTSNISVKNKITLSENKPLIALVHDALVMGIRDYFFKQNFNNAVLGFSGGIDSAIVLALAVKALGKENVHAELMPSQYSSDHSVSDSLAMVKTLEVSHQILPIESIFNSFLDTLKNDFKNLLFDVTEENLQARIRGVLLMALSNKFKYILLNTSNKSELAVGYGTLYGDMCGGLSVIGDLYKTQVFELAHYINRNQEIIPAHIITKPPSAELRPDQKDTDSLPEYNILDQILMLYIDQSQGPDEIIAKGLDEKLVQRILSMVNRNEYKRHQFAPILRVSPKSFGRGRRMPIVGKYLC